MIEPRYAQEMAFYLTARVTFTTNDLSDGGTGTAFFISIAVWGQKKLLLVTNRHVISRCDGEIYIVLNKSIDNRPYWGDTVELRIKDFFDLYYTHPDESVDLVAVDVTRLEFSDLPYIK